MQLEEADAEASDPDFIPDFVLAAMAENPVSGITRLPVANAISFGIPPNDGVGYGLVLAPVFPALFKGGWSLLTRTTIPAVLTLPVRPSLAPSWEILATLVFWNPNPAVFDTKR
jgi:hypothetical protein